ncbi:MAG: ArsA-related P-loop ATPase [bacterium]
MKGKNTTTPPPRLVLLYGIGGVGKTSLAASLATLSALKGRNTVVFTVDPARRLADSLGMSISEDEVTEVKLNFDSDQPTGSLKASMLHLDTAAKTLVMRYSPMPSLADKISSNPVFLAALRQMSNTEECLAWGKVYQLLTDTPMDTLIVDTPPAGSAPKFFHAPEQLLRLLEPAHIDLIKKPLKKLFRRKINLKKDAPSLLAAFLSGITGKTWLDEARDLIFSLQDFYDDFYYRVNDLQKILKNPQRTSILLVSSCNPSSIQETHRIASTLLLAQFPLKGIIFNRTSSPFFPGPSSAPNTVTTKFHTENLDREELQELDKFIREHHKRVISETRSMKSFLKGFPVKLAGYKVPLLAHEITSLEELETLHPYLIDCLDYF